MIVGIRDAAKLVAVAVLAACAVFVCTLFLNYYQDLTLVDADPLSPAVRVLYEAQLSTAKIVCAVTGGCLLLTSVVMLFFYIKHYLDAHKQNLGILKALGYSEFRIAKHFWVFGISVFAGAAVGFGGAFFLMPSFYAAQNENGLLPDLTLRFYPSLFLFLVILPTVFFAFLSILYACLQLRKPTLALLKNRMEEQKIRKRSQGKPSNAPFLIALKRETLRSRKTLVFFILFAAFCYSAMTQMSLGMDSLDAGMAGWMILVIGLLLAVVTLLLAVTTIIDSNKKTIALMHACGYSQKQCRTAILDGYRPAAYLGFLIGTGYQYGLLKLMVLIVFREVEGIPADYAFDIPAFLLSLITFLILYELSMGFFAGKLKKISVREIMQET